jgi:branched-chain amino acid transport system ATP-binding protein
MTLELKDIHISYGRTEIIKGVSCQFTKGKIITLIGSNGAGKSTILRGITGLSTLTGGQITFEGKNIGNLSTMRIVKMGIAHCPEGRRVFPHMNVRENLILGAYLEKDHKGKKARMESVLNKFPRLQERFNQLAGTLSGGEQQMLAIGRALMAAPSFLLLDEPSLGLAPLVVRIILEIIENIKNEGIGVILVEQNANLALELSSYAYVLENGRLALEGKASELRQNEKVKKAYLGG